MNMNMIGDWVQRHIAEPITALWDFVAGIKTDSIVESTTDAGVSFEKSGIETTSKDSIIVKNDTPATVGTPLQNSPRVRFRSHAWNNGTAADVTSDFILESRCYASANPPETYLELLHSHDGAAYGLILNLNRSAVVLSKTVTGIYEIISRRNDIRTTSTDGLVAYNLSAATAGIPVQMSPRIQLRGQVWNTTTGASNTSKWIAENVPVSGASPYGVYKISHDLNGAGYISKFFFDSRGKLGIGETPNATNDFQVLRDTDARMEMGRLRFGYDGSGADYPIISHVDYVGGNQYNLTFAPSGNLTVNSENQTYLKIANSTVASILATGITGAAGKILSFDPDGDSAHRLGYAKIGYDGTTATRARYTHGNAAAIVSGLSVDATGNTDLNCPNGQSLTFRNNSVTHMFIQNCAIIQNYPNSNRTAYDNDFDNEDIFTSYFTSNSSYGLVFARETVTGKGGIFRVEAGTIYKVDADSSFEITKDTASKINIYFDGGYLRIQNKTGSDNLVAMVGVYLVG